MEHDQVELPPGRVLPDDIRCMKCNSWLRGGPQAWGRALDQESVKASSPKTLWLSVAALGAGVAAIIAYGVLSPEKDTDSKFPALLAALVFTATAIGLAVAAVHPMLRERGGMIAGVGAAVGFVLAPLVYFLVSIFT